jgi:uncharacterized protein (DUF1697 family)
MRKIAAQRAPSPACLAATILFYQSLPMTTYIALLRGIGGGIRSLQMKPLIKAVEAIGLADVRTYIATGNIVFSSRKKAPQLARQIEACIEKQFGFRSTTVVLSAAELERAIKDNPFPQADKEPTSLHLFFLAAKPKAPQLEAMLEIKAPNEQFMLQKQVFYFYAPTGFGVSKLAPRIERLLGVAATARNWRTVGKVNEMATAK